jgi:two-component system, OmpR family, sensor histidine kinase KdpD
MKLFPFSSVNLPGLIVWILGWVVLWFLDRYLELGNLGLILVLTSAIAAIWLSVSVTLVFSLVALMAFNWAFVPPRGTFTIHFHQDVLLLLAMLVVNIIIAGLMASLREKSRQVQAHADAVDILRSWSDSLRDIDDPHQLLPLLQKMLRDLIDRPSVFIALRNELPLENNFNALIHSMSTEKVDEEVNKEQIDKEQLDKEQIDALWHCLRTGQSLGPATGRYQELNDLYLPLRGRKMTYGAVMIRQINSDVSMHLPQAQALCDQMGIALERRYSFAQEQQARDQAQAQSVRNTLLAAISHDYRTPLATIMSAASSLEQQSERMLESQRKKLAQSIGDEADRLQRLTQNVLQLARLDAIESNIKLDWESAEEIIGGVVHRLRAHKFYYRLDIKVDADLPLIRGDSLLLSQLLDNLIDNAFKYSIADSPIEINAYVDNNSLVIAVKSYGVIEAAPIENIFLPFQRGDQGYTEGAGVGLALCRAIAHAHAGDLLMNCENSSITFECHLPIVLQPLLDSTEASS